MNLGLRSGDVAAAAGVNRQTLRYYERRGLLAEPDRSLGGHRLYPPETITTLRVIKAAQRLGFTLDEVAELLDAGRRHRHRRPRQHGNEAGLAARAQLSWQKSRRRSPTFRRSLIPCEPPSTRAVTTWWSAPAMTAVPSPSPASPERNRPHPSSWRSGEQRTRSSAPVRSGSEQKTVPTPKSASRR